MTGLLKNSFLRKTSRTRVRRQRGYTQAVTAHLEPLEPRQLMSADLTGTFATAPVAVTGGTRQSVVLNVQNLGTTRAKGPVAIDVFAVPVGTTFDPATAQRLTRVKRGGSIGAGSTVSTTIRVPVGVSVASGNYQLVAVIDAKNRIAESDETNNVVQSSAFVVTQRAVDVLPSISLASAPAVFAGVASNAVARVTFSNMGSTSFAPNTQVGLRVVARPFGATDSSQDVVLTSPAARINVSNLAPGGSRSSNVLLRFPSTLTAGSFNLVVQADPTNALAETLEGNNEATLATPITVSLLPAGTILGNGTVVGSGGIGNSIPAPGAFNGFGTAIFNNSFFTPPGLVTVTPGSATLPVATAVDTGLGLTPVSTVPGFGLGLTPVAGLIATPVPGLIATPISTLVAVPGLVSAPVGSVIGTTGVVATSFGTFPTVTTPLNIGALNNVGNVMGLGTII